MKFFKTSIKKFSNTVKLGDFARYKPYSTNYIQQNFFNSKWNDSKEYEHFKNPLTGESGFLKTPLLRPEDCKPIAEEMKKVPNSGLHNPLKKPERYLMYGDICRKVSQGLHDPEIFQHFVDLICTVIPKSQGQSAGEMRIVRNFFDNFAGDNVRYLARGFHIPGDYTGQTTSGWRWPYGATAVITPFNFPVEIPIMQLIGSLFMGNKCVLKGDSKVALPTEEFFRFLHACGMPKEDALFVLSDGPSFEKLLLDFEPKMTLFTGSNKTAKRLTEKLNGRIKLEADGLDWKILGPDAQEVEYVAHWIDHDSFGLSGQKCSAESLLFVHENWTKTDLYEQIKKKAMKRTLKDLTIGPILSWDNKRIAEHINKVTSIKGAEILFGGKPLEEKHSIPDCYGSYQPTAIKVPLSALEDPKYYEILTTELFGPFKLVFEYKESELDKVLKFFDGLEQKLTCGVVSNDHHFLNKVLANSSNGTTYAGIRARTTGAPQNHWFGPGGDPRAGGIGSIEAIRLVWSHHREIVFDSLIPKDKSYKLVQS